MIYKLYLYKRAQKKKMTFYINVMREWCNTQPMSVSPNLFFFFFLGTHLWHMEVPRLGSHWSYSCWPSPQPQNTGSEPESAAYTTVHNNTGSSTHWARPGIEPASLWILLEFLNCWATKGTPLNHFLKWRSNQSFLCDDQKIPQDLYLLNCKLYKGGVYL